MDQGSLPLSALLSQALVAFTIEFDNAAELQMEHRTTLNTPAGAGVWLTSMAMWLNCMRYVGAEPVTLGEVARLARTRTNLDGMRRWGYISVEPGKGTPDYKAGRDTLTLRATQSGMLAREIWLPLTDLIEQRWVDRYGADHIGRLRAVLAELVGRFGRRLPDCLPILGFGLQSTGKGADRDREGQAACEPDGETGAAPTEAAATAALPLPWLLARVLLAFAIAYERESRISLAIAANVLRVLDERGVRVRDLPELSGVSKEAIAMAMGFTASRDITVTGADPDGGRWRVARLTPKGSGVREAYADRVESIEGRWGQQYGSAVMTALRTSLERLAGPGGPASPLFAALEPAPGNWRCDVRPPQTLPHFPMVLHRGGYPDGS